MDSRSQEPTDGELVARARAGGDDGRRAYQVLVARHQARLVRLVSYLLGRRRGDAEDVAQEAFVRAYLALGRYPEDAAFWPWMRVIATRLAFNHRRDDATRQRYHDALAEPEDPGDGVASRDALMHVLDRLPEVDRQVLVLRFVEELSVQEIASALGIGISAAKMRLSRAREEFLSLYRRDTGSESDEA